MITGLAITRFEPIHLKIEGIGPFRAQFELPFVDAGGGPANFFLLVSRNGFGKTTVLETVLSLMWLLGVSPLTSASSGERGRYVRPELLDGAGRAQLDARVTLEHGGRSHVAVVSLCCGADEPIRVYPSSLVEEAQADVWLPLVCPRAVDGAGYRPYRRENELDRLLLESIRTFLVAEMAPEGLFDERVELPTALFFPADRQIVRPPEGERAVQRPDNFCFRTAHRFGIDGRTWTSSLDGLLVWLEWLGRERFDEAKALVNELMYRNATKRLAAVDRNALSAIIDTGSGYHRIDQLSHGERALLHILLRTACHMAGSSILLIDELDIHLHPKWQFHLMRILKRWVSQRANLTVIASTHQAALIEAFHVEEQEDGLSKGGFIIDPEEL